MCDGVRTTQAVTRSKFCPTNGVQYGSSKEVVAVTLTLSLSSQ
jgi:hypothetical protein